MVSAEPAAGAAAAPAPAGAPPARPPPRPPPRRPAPADRVDPRRIYIASLLFGTAAALGFALVAGGWRVLFARTTDLVQRLQIARRELALEAAIARLDKYHLLILDDLAYVTKDQAETSVLFELISARYERRSLLITANQPFGEWGTVFPDPAITVAVVDRLVHHSTIFELNVESYRRRAAMQRKQLGPGRPANHATPKNVGVPPSRDNQPSP